MQQYLNTLKLILETGKDHPDRTKVGRRSIFGHQERYNLTDGFPLVTTRKIFTKAMVSELLWFIKGETDTSKGGCPDFWDRWAVKEQHIDHYLTSGSETMEELAKEDIYKAVKANIMDDTLNSIGPMYGNVWRDAPITMGRERAYRTLEQLPSDKLKLYQEEYEELCFLNKEENPTPFIDYANNRYAQSVDQLNELILNLKERPHSSRHCITAWIPEYIPPETVSPQEAVLQGYGCLAPCHAFFQFFVHPTEEGQKPTIDCQLYIRSNDAPIGRPYNIAQYSLLLCMVAQVVDMVPGEFILTTGDLHIYSNQIEQAKEQLTREPLPLPTLKLNPEVKDIFAFTLDDIKIEGYQHQGKLDYPVAV